MIRIAAPAKVNLSLRVLAREESGYHSLETLFLAIGLEDSIAVTPGGRGISLEVEGPSLGPVEENLVYRAAEGFLDLAGRRDAGLLIRLVKRIPVQGGLGGGSSDAAATLRALSSLFPDRVSQAQLRELAGRLGSDISFFLSPSPLAMAWGRGERLLALPALPGVPVLLAIPPFGISTPEAYALLAKNRTDQPGRHPPELRTLESFGSWIDVASWATNDFEPVLFRAYPALEEIRRAMTEQAPRIALVSGSGSSLFAVFDTDAEAWAAKGSLEDRFTRTRFILTRTLTTFPGPILTSGVEP